MGIREIIMQDLYEEGLEEGIQLGIEKGIEKGMEKGIEKGIEKGLDKKTTSIIKKMLIKHPEWDNELIADLADTSVEKVVEVRASLKKEK